MAGEMLGESVVFCVSGTKNNDYKTPHPFQINRCQMKVIDFGSREVFYIKHSHYLQSIMFVVEFDNDDMSIYVDDIADAIIQYAEINICERDEELAKNLALCISHVTNDITHIWGGLTGKKNRCIGNKLYITIPFNVFPIHLHSLLQGIEVVVKLEDKINLVKRKEDIDKCKIKNIYIHEQIHLFERICENSVRAHFLDSYIHEEHIKQWLSEEYDINTSVTDNNITKHRLNLNGICDELIWVYIDENAKSDKYFNYISLADRCVLIADGYEFYNPNDADFYQNIQQLNYHTSQMNNVYVYSFSVDPEKKEEVGMCNLSCVDHLELKSFLNNNPEQNKYKLKIFAKVNNIIKYRGGLGGCKYLLK